MQQLYGISLCSGIGGFEEGLKKAGLHEWLKVIQFVEINPYCQSVLRKNYPGIPIHDDLRTYNPIGIDGSRIVLFGGIPCQPFSHAGKRKGGNDKRDMFPEFFRLLRRVQPRWALVENVPGLLTINAGRYFRGILWQFAQAGYDVEWQVISCAQVGGVHRRERVWIIAYSRCPHGMSQQCQTTLEREKQVKSCSSNRLLANTQSPGRDTSRRDQLQEQTNITSQCCCDIACTRHSIKLANTEKTCSGRQGSNLGQKTFSTVRRENDGLSSELDGIRAGSYLLRHAELCEWLPKAIDTDSIPKRKERLQALGNAVVPNVASIVWQRLATIVGESIDEKAS